MYLRKKDHRDIIYQDMYHNAMWCNTEDIEDELTWVKYPNKGLMTRYFGWMDAERQFEYCVSGITGGHSVNVRKLECGLIVREDFYSSSNWSVYVSEDGIVWQRITNISTWMSYPNHFGSDGFCYVRAISSGLGYNTEWDADIARFFKDEEDGTWYVERRHYVFDQGLRPPRALVVCHDDDGVIVCKQTRYNTNPVTYDEAFYKLNWDGTTEFRCENLNVGLSFPNAGYVGSPETIRYCKNGDKLACAYYAFNGANNYNYPLVRVSNDDGYTWTTTRFGQATMVSYTYVYKIALFCRQGNFYCLVGCGYPDRDGVWKANETVMFASFSGMDWTKQTLPASVDIDVLQEGGQGVVKNPTMGETITLAIDPQNAGAYDYKLMDFLGDQYLLDYGEFNLMTSKGEITEPSQEDFWVTFSNGSVFIYFDNRDLDESENNFAWQQTGYSISVDGADYIQQGDYCMEGE